MSNTDQGGGAGQGNSSPELVVTYETEGYIVLPDLLDGEDLRPAREAMMQKVDLMAADLLAKGLVEDPREEEPFPTRLARLFDGLTDQDFLAYGRGWRDRFPGYYQLMTNPKILDVVECLIGGEIFANPAYNVRPKVPGVAAGAVPWHQDRSYWPDSKASPVITVWIALVDATQENGCLCVIPKTHRQDMLGFHAETYSGTGYTEIDDDRLGPILRKRARTLPVRAGTAIVFNDRFIHSSGPNRSDHVRWSVDLRYQPADQDPMPQHGVGFLARSRRHPERVASLSDWLACRPETGGHDQRTESGS